MGFLDWLFDSATGDTAEAYEREAGRQEAAARRASRPAWGERCDSAESNAEAAAERRSEAAYHRQSASEARRNAARVRADRAAAQAPRKKSGWW